MKHIILSCFFILLSFFVSCGVTINPYINIQLDKENISFDYTQVGLFKEKTIVVTNIGNKEARVVSFRLNFNSTNTNDTEFEVEPSVMPTFFMLGHNESQSITIKFSPKSVGDKSTTLVIQTIVYDESITYKYPITGRAYEGKLRIYPYVVGYPHSYIGEKRTMEFSIFNDDTRALTITSISFIDLDSNVSPEEFKIIKGWNGNQLIVEPNKPTKITVEFDPISLGYKSLYLVIRIAESDFETEAMLAAFCCEHIEILTHSIMPDAEHGKEYFLKLQSSGGNGRNYGVVEGELPEGLEVDNQTSSIIGIPIEHGDYKFTIQVWDSAGHTTSKIFRLHVNYAILYRDPLDVDPVIIFDRYNYSGTFTVNLIAESDIPLEIKSIELSGLGVWSYEARISSNNVPDVMYNGQTARIVISVVSLLDDARYVTLTIEHSGYNTDLIIAFEWDLIHQQQKVFILDISNDMGEEYSGQVFDMHHNVIPEPTNLQLAQYLVAECISKLHPGDSFDVLLFEDNVYACFGVLQDANAHNRELATNWVYFQDTRNYNNLYDALLCAYNNYGNLDSVEFFTIGKPDTALTLGYGPGTCSEWIGDRIVTDLENWMAPHIAWNPRHELIATQIGGSPISFMTQIGSLPNSTFELR